MCSVELLCLPYYEGKNPSWQGLLGLSLGNCFERQLHSFYVESKSFSVGFRPL